MRDFKSSTIYQIYTRSFQDSNGSGQGDIRGVIRRLDYLIHSRRRAGSGKDPGTQSA